jgi:hypothetical protein
MSTRRLQLGMLGLAALLAAGCAATPDQASLTPPAAVADPGIRVESLRLTAADYMLDLRYRITDMERAAPFFSRKTELQLVDPVSGARLAVPNTPKLGRLRQVARKDMPDRSYFVLFANPGRYLKAGSQVILVAGDTHIAKLTIE